MDRARKARRHRVPARLGLRSGPLLPRADGEPWKLHDYKNWCRRVWHPAVTQAKTDSARASSKGKTSGIPPYDLRHTFASLQIRAELSMPELAEQMGHSPQMTVGTYAHVIRELRGDRACPKSRSSGPAGKAVDVWWTSTRSEAPWHRSSEGQSPCKQRDSSAWIRTRDLTIMSRAL